MKYVRFLKATKVELGRCSSLITITSDLGETFYPGTVDLHLSACAPFPETTVFARKTVRWMAGMRALPVMLDLDRRWQDRPFQVRVSIDPAGVADTMKMDSDGLQLPPILSAWSDVVSIADLKAGRKAERWKAERRIALFNGRIVRCWEDIGETIVGHVWDAGVAMSAYMSGLILQASRPPQGESMDYLSALLQRPPTRPIRIIELGTGTGVLGLTFAQSLDHASVVLTDEETGRTLAQRSIAATLGGATRSTADPSAEAMDVDDRPGARFKTLVWGTPIPPELDVAGGERWDLICASDCTYNPDSSPALVATIDQLAGPPGVGHEPCVAIGMKRRHESEEVFFDLMARAGFTVRGRATLPLPTHEAEAEEEVQIWLFGREQ